jgi:hypothetical protein
MRTGGDVSAVGFSINRAWQIEGNKGVFVVTTEVKWTLAVAVVL